MQQAVIFCMDYRLGRRNPLTGNTSGTLVTDGFIVIGPASPPILLQNDGSSGLLPFDIDDLCLLCDLKEAGARVRTTA
jgi:hypothetical protein